MIPHSRPTLGPEEQEAVRAVLESGKIAQGPKVIEFEKKFCGHTGRRYAIAVSSGTAALQLSLMALGIQKGDEVIVPSFTCVALLHALDGVGARPVVADICLETFNLSLAEIKKKIRRKTKAVIAPHSFGLPIPLTEFEKLPIPVLEDGTQALGASIGKRRVGSFGALSIFSFYATKMITTGEGGILLTDSRKWAERLHDLRDYDKKESYRFRTNSKMTDLEAAIGVEQLKKLPSFVVRRREIARRYQESLGGTAVILPFESPTAESVYYRYVIRVPRRPKEWMRELRVRGVDAKEPIFKPLHRYLNLPDSQFPAATQAFRECVSLPLYPSLSDAECDEVCRALRGELNRVEV